MVEIVGVLDKIYIDRIKSHYQGLRRKILMNGIKIGMLGRLAGWVQLAKLLSDSPKIIIVHLDKNLICWLICNFLQSNQIIKLHSAIFRKTYALPFVCTLSSSAQLVNEDPKRVKSL